MSEPLLTKEAIDGLNDEMYAPMNVEDRDIKNIYEIIEGNGMSDLLDETKFGSLFGLFERIIVMEKEYFLKNVKY